MPLNIKGRRGRFGLGFKETFQSSSTPSSVPFAVKTYIIPLEDYGITEGFIAHQAPYSNAEWKLAYDNVMGIEDALNYAHDNGYAEVILPRGDYNVCYYDPNTVIDSHVIKEGYGIKIPSNLTFNLNASRIKAILDSENRNPYDLRTSRKVNRLVGCVFYLMSSHNSSICNGEIIGDRYERSFLDDTEKAMEITFAVIISEGTAFASVHNLKMHGFMGDAIGCMTTQDPDLGSNIATSTARTFYPGMIDDTGTLVAEDGAYSTNLVDITRFTSKEMMMRTNLGYTRIPDVENQDILLTWYDDDGAYISQQPFKFLQLTVIPHNATQIRMTIFNEAECEESVYKTFQLCPPIPHHFHVHHCEIYNNNRGGISNQSNDVLIEYNKFYNNGMGRKFGHPEFPDPTRYHINNEDNLANKVTIRNNQFYDGFHAILSSGLHVDVQDNYFYNMTGSCVALYSFETAIVAKNKFEKCTRCFSVTSTDRSRRLVASENILENSGVMSLATAQNTTFMLNNSTVKSMFVDVRANENNNLCRLTNCYFEDNYNPSDLYAHNFISGQFLDCIFQINEPQVSTATVYIDVWDGSRNAIINIANPKKRFCEYSYSQANKTDMKNCTIYGGLYYSGWGVTESKTKLIKDVNIIGVSQFRMQSYGTPTDATNVLNVEDSHIEFNGADSITSLFSSPTNSTDGNMSLTLNFENCTLKLADGVLDNTEIFDMSYYGANHNVTINLTNCVIDASETTATGLRIADDRTSGVNTMNINLTNTTIKGTIETTGIDNVAVNTL